MTIDKVENARGLTEITIRLDKGETYPAGFSTKREYVGPGTIFYLEDRTGVRDYDETKTTARLRLKA